MSTKKDFQCLVHLYDIKYMITVTENHRGWMLFSDLYRKIQQLDPKQEISFETNTFEIFDSKENRFKRITSFNEIIENESRIRVLIKPQVFKNYLYDSDKRSDVTNSYQTSDNRNLSHTFGLSLDQTSDKSQNYAQNGIQLTDNYSNTYNKIDFHSNKSQVSESRVWSQTSSSSLRGLSTGPSMSSVQSLMSPVMVSTVEPSVLETSSSTQPSDYDWRTAYCPNKVVEYSDNAFSLDRNYSTENCNTNSYQTVSSTSASNSAAYSSNDSNVNYIMDKLIESRNIVVREQTLEELRRQGVEVKQNFNFDIYLCKVCDECFQTMESALDHTRSLEHFDLKSGKFADELDRSLIIPTDRVIDISVVLARKQELKKLDLKTKYEFLRHGIRIKDGIGTNAYVCLECKVSFMSFNYVRHHLSKFKGQSQQPESEAVYSSNTFQGPVKEERPLPSSWRQALRGQSQPVNSGAQGSKNSWRPLGRRRRRRAEKRKLNAISNPESEVVSNSQRRKRIRTRKRTRNRNRSHGSKERQDEKPKDLIKSEPGRT